MKKERTLVIVKPDGVQRGLIGEIIGRYEKTGLKLLGIKMIVPAEETVDKHYSLDPNWKKSVGEKAISAYKKNGQTPPSEDPIVIGDGVLSALKKYFTSGPVVAMVWQGANAVGVVRKITGGTEPLSSDVGSIRGDFTIDSYPLADVDKRAVRNLVHASGNVDEASKEIPLWFSESELVDYRLIHDAILYDVNLDGIIE